MQDRFWYKVANSPAILGDIAPTDLSAIDDFARLALSKREGGIKAEPYRWNREEIYAERESRWLREQDEEFQPTAG